MTDLVAGVEPGKLDIGRVIQQTFAVLGRNFVAFGVLSLILAGIPAAASTAIQIGNLTEAGQPNLGLGYLSSIGWITIATVIVTAILQGALTYGSVQDMAGARASVGESLATGLRAFLPLVGFSILATLAMVFGLVLLIVPGIMMACAWCVGVPALVAERTGVFGAFSRSAELTRGNRWRIFGLFVIVGVIAVVVSSVIGAVGMGLFLATGGDAAALASNPLQIGFNAISSALSTMLTSTGVAVLYVELRKARGGLSTEWLSEIFS